MGASKRTMKEAFFYSLLLQLNPDIVAVKISVFPDISAISMMTNFLLNKNLQNRRFSMKLGQNWTQI